MKLRVLSVVCLIVLTVAAVGLGLSVGTWYLFQRLDAEAAVAGHLREDLGRAELLQQTVEEWEGATHDALAADDVREGMSHARDAQRLAESVLTRAEEVAGQAPPQDLIQALAAVGRANAALLELLGAGPDRDPAELKALRVSAAGSVRLVGHKARGLVDLARERHRHAQEEAALERRRATALLTLLGIGYVGLILGLLRWSLSALVAPIRHLTANARRGQAGEDTPFEPLAVGPLELRELSSAFAALLDRIQEAKAEVESEVEERTAQLVAANRSKTEFLANTSHEIRTPMTAILGFVDLLLDERNTQAEHDEYLETIRQNGLQLLGIINDILDLSRIELSGLQIEELEFCPRELVDSVVRLLRERSRAKGLRLQVDVAEDVPRLIRTDQNRLRQILVNLVGNAVKFTERGGVRIRLAVIPEEVGRAQLRFEVFDTGIGIPEDKLESIFDAFAQADSSHSRRYGGTGLGLSISRQLARIMGGDLVAMSWPGEGSCFRLDLDLRRLRAHSTGSEPAFDELLAQAAPPARRRLRGRMLVADDALDNRRLLSLILSRAGMEVDLAEDGHAAVVSALQALDAGTPYDAVLMDIQMPELDGYGATRELRRAGYDRPIVALTAHAMRGDRERCLAAGCDEYLTKPVDKGRLIELIAELLDKAEPPQGGSSSG